MAITGFTYETPYGTSEYARVVYFELTSKRNLTLNPILASVVFYTSNETYDSGQHNIYRKMYRCPILISELTDNPIIAIENYIVTNHSDFTGGGH